VSRPLFEETARKVLAQVRGGSAELLFTARNEGLTRFGNNVVSQHVQSRDHEVTIRVLKGRRQGRASCNQLDDAALARAVRRAEELADRAPDDPSLLPPVGLQTYPRLPEASAATLALEPDEKVEAVRSVVSDCRKKGLTAAGIFSHGVQAVGLANSEGLMAFHEGTSATFSMTVMGKDSSGWAELSHRDVSKIAPVELGRRAVEKAVSGQRPKTADAGEYTVILEPAAVAELIQFMAWEGFGALPYQEGRSFMTGRIGRRMMDERVTILDDVQHPDTIGMPFDFEGVPRRRVMLIEQGTAKGVVYDRKTARKEGIASTGHALPQPSLHGPMPLNLVMRPGDATIEEMIRTTERGLWVIHFHYTNLLDPVRLTITGMTRDGTYRVEKGKVRNAVKNLRFTESVVEAFDRIEAVGRETVYTHSFWGGGIVCPAVKIRGFNFSSATRF
jgi:predicted Zn-dependent protease